MRIAIIICLYDSFVFNTSTELQIGSLNGEKDNSKYVNHSDDPNLDDDGFAIKDINIGDEIVINYKDFDDSIDKWLI